MVVVARVRLSNEQWSEIAEASGLPNRARQRIEGMLTNYRMFQQASAREPFATQTRKELLRIAKLAEKLITTIIGVKADSLHHARINPDLLSPLMLPTSRLAATVDDMTAVAPAASRDLNAPTTRDAVQRLYERVLSVEQLRTWFENAASSLPRDARGPHKAAENHLWLVRQLDAILAEFTGRQGRQISASYKDDLRRYVELCFAAVDPNVGPGSIKKAIEAYAHLNPRRRRAVP